MIKHGFKLTFFFFLPSLPFSNIINKFCHPEEKVDEKAIASDFESFQLLFFIYFFLGSLWLLECSEPPSHLQMSVLHFITEILSLAVEG